MFTLNQKQAIQDYIDNARPESMANDDDFEIPITDATFQLNRLLRAKVPPANTVQYIQELDEAIVSRPIRDKLVAYRGANYKNMYRWIQNDKWYVDPGYLSTSKSLSTAARFVRNAEVGYEPALLIITFKSGAPVLDIKEAGLFSDNEEAEVLVKRSAKFSIEKSYQFKYSQLSELNQEPLILATGPGDIDFDVNVIHMTFDSYLEYPI